MKDSLVVGIIAPSGYVADPATLDRAAAYFERRGHRVVVDPAARLRSQRFAGTDDERLASLHRIAARDDVDLVIAARGGYGLSRLLGRIDFAQLAASGKLFVGHSDIAALLLGLWARTHTPSLAGPTSCFDFGGESISPFTEENFWAALGAAHHVIRVDAPDQPPCSASGPLWGGNLAMVTHLLGTPYFPEIDGGILFLEDVAEHPYRIERMLLQLHHAGVLDAQAAILLGDFSGYRLLDNDNGYDLASAIDTVRRFTRTPILTGLPFGHVRDKVSLPIGGMGQLEADGSGWTLGVTHPDGPWERLG
jgi:muramoyltetrapeptide carboxypeptidase